MNGKKEFNYLVEKARMIKRISYNNSAKCDDVDCNKCPLSRVNNGHGISCHDYEALIPIEATATIKAWAEKHPKKTLLEDLLEKYPCAVTLPNGVPDFCAELLGITDKCNCECKECWNQELEADNDD